MIATTSWFDYIQADNITRLQLDRQAAAHRESMKELRVQSMLLSDLVQLGVEQVKGLATIAAGVEGVQGEVELLRHDVQSLGALFDWRLDQILDQFHDQTRRLDNIEDVLRRPLETQAQEWWDRGQLAAEQGLTEEAIRFYGEAIEKSPLLYPAHLQLGFLYAYQQFDFAAAAKSFALADRYAAKDDPPTAAQACFQLHKLEREAGNLEQAWDHINRSCQLDPTLGPAWWDRATLALGTGRTSDIVPCLERAISTDPLYWHRAKANDWDSAQHEVDTLLTKLLNAAVAEAPRIIAELKSTVTAVFLPVQRLPRAMAHRVQGSMAPLNHRLEEISTATKSDSFAILRAAIVAAHAQRRQLREFFSPIQEYLIIERGRLAQEEQTMTEKKEADLTVAAKEIDVRDWHKLRPNFLAVAGLVGLIAFAMHSAGSVVLLVIFALAGGAYFFKRNSELARAKQTYLRRSHWYEERQEENRATQSAIDGVVRMLSTISG